MKPQFSGWKFQKIFELPPPSKQLVFSSKWAPGKTFVLVPKDPWNNIYLHKNQKVGWKNSTLQGVEKQTTPSEKPVVLSAIFRGFYITPFCNNNCKYNYNYTIGANPNSHQINFAGAFRKIRAHSLRSTTGRYRSWPGHRYSCWQNSLAIVVCHIPPKKNIHPWEMVVGRLLSYWRVSGCLVLGHVFLGKEINNFIATKGENELENGNNSK